MSETTTPFGAADLTQDPSLFAKLATGEASVDKAVEAPKTESTVENPATVGHPQDNAVKPADEKTPEVKASETKPSTNEAKQQTDKPAPAPKLSPEDFRKREADKMIQRQGEEKKRLFMAAVDMVKADPASIASIAKYDKTQADAVVKEIWGYDSMEELATQSRLTELKQSDPDRADLEERLMKLEKDVKVSEKTQQEQADQSFFATKKMQVNPIDPAYAAVMDNLKKLDSTFVKNNRTEALSMAYNLAYASSSPVTPEESELQEAVNKQASEGSGNGITTSHTGSSPYAPEQQGFAGLVGVQLT